MARTKRIVMIHYRDDIPDTRVQVFHKNRNGDVYVSNVIDDEPRPVGGTFGTWLDAELKDDRDTDGSMWWEDVDG